MNVQLGIIWEVFKNGRQIYIQIYSNESLGSPLSE